MNVKVFISHQRLDSAAAVGLADRLRQTHRIECYLDVVDPMFGQYGSDIANHIRFQLGKCTQLLAVVSHATSGSWWVPWEIGVATEKDFPLATYTGTAAGLPEYLRKWPYLKDLSDLDLYAAESKKAAESLSKRPSYLAEDAARSASTNVFFANLRKSLHQ